MNTLMVEIRDRRQEYILLCKILEYILGETDEPKTSDLINRAAW